MKILAIESSCDETAASIIEDGRKIISNIVASSASMHEKTGGIIPEAAAREQVVSIIPVINETLGNLSLKKDIDSFAVTIGPGLIGSLLVGVETAKTLSMLSGKPIIPVNHVIAHLYANFLNDDNLPIFPCLGLVISGGHTELFLMEKINKLKWVGGTLDDASGEAFDKTARILGLGFPGGPAIAVKALEFRNKNKKPDIKLPRPMINDKSLNFSFSGLKTAVLREVYNLKQNNQFNNLTICELAYEIEESITDVLVAKTLKAVKQFKVKSLLVGGGVAANKRLSLKFKEKIESIDLRIPPPSLCTDNAAYISSYAFFYKNKEPWQKIEARPDLSVEESI